MALALAAIGAEVGSGGGTIEDFNVPGTQSQEAVNLLEKRVPVFWGAESQAVLATRAGSILSPELRAVIEDSVLRLKRVPQIATVIDPLRSGSISRDRRAALIQMFFSVPEPAVRESSLRAVERALSPAHAAGLEVQFAGEVYPGSRIALSEVPELVGIAIGVMILLVTFGTFVAAGLPLLTALIGVVIAVMGVTALSAIVDVASASVSLALMLGLSCGIDYALFVLSRHRTNLLQGQSVEDSVALAAGTAGSSVCSPRSHSSSACVV
jgi:RND superfamily putative drug exporter